MLGGNWLTPEIDRRKTVSSEPGRVRDRSVLVVAIAAILVIGAGVGLVIGIEDDGGSSTPEVPGGRPAKILYTTHDPIIIAGNEGFTDVNGVVSGSGSASDPYIISGWDINASSANGIEIIGTDAHFTIRDCSLHDGMTSNSYGISLESVVNGTLTNNIVSRNWFGIYLHSSNENIVSDNLCSGNCQGVFTLRSDRNILDGNTCTMNDEGIVIDTGSDNNVVSNNNCSGNNDDCMFVDNAKNNTLAGNNCSDSDYGIIVTQSSWNNTLISNTCNFNSYDGIYLSRSDSNILDSNNCSSNGNWGMHISDSTSNVLMRNQLCGNSLYGVYVYSASTSNMIFNNTFIGNNGAGSIYDPAHVQAYDEVPGNWWNDTGGFGNYWSDWTSPDDVPPYGFVDVPYDIAGAAGAEDYYPQTTPQAPIPEFGVMPLITIVVLVAFLVARSARRRDE